MLFMGIDLGTTGLKAVLADEEGRILGSGYRTYPLEVPRPGWTQQDPIRWYGAMCEAIRAALKETGADPAEIGGVSFSGQMHGLVALDASGEVLCPAIIHCDGRAGKQRREALGRVTREQLERWVQNRPHCGFQALSLMWLREERSGIYARLRHALLPKDYLRYRLTGEYASEVTDACSTLLFDCAHEEWSRDMLEALDIDPSVLPEAGHRPADPAGRVTRQAALETGLREGTPVVFGGGDSCMQAVGNGLLEPGCASVNLGTSAQLLAAMDRPYCDPMLRTHTFCHAPAGRWYIMGAVLNACLAQNWFADGVLGGAELEALTGEAGRTPPGARGLIFLPYLTGERTPHMNENARAAFLGLTLAHSRGDMLRAVLEGVAYSLRDCLEIIRELKVPADRVTLSGGGARSGLWRQILADVLEMPLVRTDMREQAAMGAIICAQLARGVYSSFEEACARQVRLLDEPTLPDPAMAERYREGFDMYREAYRANRELYDRMRAFAEKYAQGEESREP